LLDVYSKVGRLRTIDARAARPAWFVLRHAALVLALVVCSFTSVAGPGSAQGGSANEPPPVPDCYSTGSGYGLCEGYVIPGGGSIVEMTYPDKKGIFKLTGPAPLQWTQSVACGDLGCVYNHLDWMVGNGLKVVAGCGTNVSACNVCFTGAKGQCVSKLSQPASGWTPVYVRQNNDPPIIYLLWLSGKTGGSIRGYVREKNMKGVLQGVAGVTVTASGSGGGSATTGDQGFYTMNVRPGSYSVVPSGGPSGPSSKFTPVSAKVSVSAGGFGRADFSLKLTPASVSVSFAPGSGKGGPLAIGKPAAIAVTVTAGKVDLNSVSLGGGLVASNSNLQVVVQAPGSSGFTLAAGASQTFVFQVQGVSPGSADVSVTATGTSDVGDVSDSAKLSLKVGQPSLKAMSVQVSTDTININYAGHGWSPSDGPIAMSFSGQAAGQLVQQTDFTGVLKIAYWPQRTTDAAISEHAGNGYCWGELAARQGTLFASTGKVQGKWAGWVLWSADPRIKAHEAFCEGEADTLFSHSPFPIVAFGAFKSGFGSFGVVAYNISGPNTASPVLILTPTSPISVSLPMYNVCIAISVSQGGILAVSTSPGGCSVPKTSG